MMLDIAYVSTYVPKKCGLATYTHHLQNCVQNAAKNTPVRNHVIAIQGPDEPRTMYSQSLWMLQRDRREDYERVATKINNSSIDLVSLQHEFGIFGGTAGEYILRFARSLRKPIVTTFHTVFERPGSPYKDIQQQLVEFSDHFIVMNPRAIRYLADAYGVAEDKISYIPHGTPGPASTPRQQLRQELGWQGKRVILTFGLQGPGKGIESIFEVLPQVVRQVPNVLYVIAGQTHPEIVKKEGEAYREQLMRVVQKHHLTAHVTMLNRYMSEQEISRLITACDLYVTPYPGMEQITSGTLAYAVGAGCPVLSTPYAYARDLLQDMPSLLIPYGDADNWAKAITRMLSDDAMRQAYKRKIEEIGCRMKWSTVGKQHWELFLDLAYRRHREGSEGLVVTR